MDNVPAAESTEDRVNIVWLCERAAHVTLYDLSCGAREVAAGLLSVAVRLDDRGINEQSRTRGRHCEKSGRQ